MLIDVLLGDDDGYGTDNATDDEGKKCVNDLDGMI